MQYENIIYFTGVLSNTSKFCISWQTFSVRAIEGKAIVTQTPIAATWDLTGPLASAIMASLAVERTAIAKVIFESRIDG